MCVMTKAKNPVLAHLFIDYLLDKANAVENFAFVGYQPAIEGIDGQYLIDQGLVPENLRSRVLSNDQIAQGLPLAAAVDRRRGAVAGRLVEVHRGRLTHGQRCGRRSRRPSQRILGIPEPAGRRLAGGRCSSCRSTRSRPSPSARSTRSCAPPIRSWNPLQWDFSAMSKVLDRVFDPDDLGRTFVRTVRIRGRRAGAVLPRSGTRWRTTSPATPGRRRGLLLAAAGAAVLDQLPDAHAGVGQPAAARRLREPDASVGCTSPVSTELAQRRLAGRGDRADLRLHPVLHPAAVRRPRAPRRPADRGGPRPRRVAGSSRSCRSPCRCRSRACSPRRSSPCCRCSATTTPTASSPAARRGRR